jgi:hypothetical protein
MRNTFEMTPTGAARAADFMNRVEDLAMATFLPPEREEMVMAYLRNSVSIDKTLTYKARENENIVSYIGTIFTNMKFSD